MLKTVEGNRPVTKNSVASRPISVPGFLILDGEANKIHAAIAGVVRQDTRFDELSDAQREFGIRQGMRFGLMPEQRLIPHALKTGQSALVARTIKRRDTMRGEGYDEDKINDITTREMRTALAAHTVRRRFTQIFHEPDPAMGDTGKDVLDLAEGVAVALHYSQ